MRVSIFLTFLLSYYLNFGVKADSVCEAKITSTKLSTLIKTLPPSLDGKNKGDAGRICVIGGSIEYTGAPYFAAITALKVGADVVSVVTTERAAPIIMSYSPDLIVYPYLNLQSASKISKVIQRADVIVIGPGLGREDEAISLTYDIISTAKTLKKPLVIDADGLFAVFKNPPILSDYPSPGVILTPNYREVAKLMQATTNDTKWHTYWGRNITVLEKGKTDTFYSSSEEFNWSSSDGGSGRRAGGQGEILAGALGTYFNWAIKSNSCNFFDLTKSVASFAAAKLTRTCNYLAYNKLGRSLTASDMLDYIHAAFKIL